MPLCFIPGTTSLALITWELPFHTQGTLSICKTGFSVTSEFKFGGNVGVNEISDQGEKRMDQIHEALVFISQTGILKISVSLPMKAQDA